MKLDRRTFFFPLTCIALVAGIVFPPISAYISVYVVLIVTLIALLASIPQLPTIVRDPSFKSLLLGLVFISGASIVAATSLEDMFIVLVLSPLLSALGIFAILQNTFKNNLPTVVAGLCTAGAGAGLLLALYDTYVLHIDRAGAGNNPIHFSGLTVIIGFMALIGFVSLNSRWRYIFLVGPLCGLFTAYLSGSRGPLLSGLVLAAVATPLVFYWVRKDINLRWLATTFILTGMGIFALIESGYFQGRIASIPQSMISLFGNTSNLDESSRQRIALYQSAADAFRDKPIFGHGFSDFFLTARQYMPEEYMETLQFDHLHSDIADFAVIGGVAGLIAYALIILSPLFAFLKAKEPNVRRTVLIGGIILSLGYFTLGLTNAMFGILPQTTLFGVLLGVLVSIAYHGRGTSVSPASLD